MGSSVALVLTILVSLISEVSCESSAYALIASSSIAVILLIIVITVLVIGLTWKEWYPKWQRWRGKVKVPRRIRKMREIRKELAKRPRTPSTVAGDKDAASYIHRWNNTREQYEDLYDTAYEEKAKSIELPEEEEVRIETYVVENETLNLGPFDKKPDKTDEFDGTTQDLYSTVNKSKKIGDEGTLSQGSSGIGSTTTPNGEVKDRQMDSTEQEAQQHVMSFSEHESSMVLF